MLGGVDLVEDGAEGARLGVERLVGDLQDVVQVRDVVDAAGEALDLGHQVLDRSHASFPSSDLGPR